MTMSGYDCIRRNNSGWAAVEEYWRQRPERLQLLQRLAAALMAVPQLRCRRRGCRRHGTCRFVRRDDLSPWCLGNLSPLEREGFNDLLNRAKLRGWDMERPGPLPHGELDFAALELDLAMTPRGDSRIRALRAFWRERAAER